MINFHHKKLFYIILHIFLGGLLFYFPFIGSYYGLTILCYFTYIILFSPIFKNISPIMCSAYIIGLEVLIRMSQSFLFWEFGKLSIIYIILIGLYRWGARNRFNVPILFYFILLLPSILHLPIDSFNLWRQNITFNLAGPACLTILSLYLSKININRKELLDILFYSLLPVLSMAIFILLRMPNIYSYNFMPYSDPVTSGGFGPNQVSTIFGFIVIALAYGQICKGSISGRNFFDAFLLLLFLALGMITFSRGGLFAAIISIILAFSYHFFFNKRKIIFVFNTFSLFAIAFFTFFTVVTITEGAISKRYGFSGESYGERMLLDLSGRAEIYKIDFAIFSDFLFTGVGPGNATQLRKFYGYGKEISAHTEYSRMLSEHGLLGLIALLILLVMPLYYLMIQTLSINKTTIILFSTLAILTLFHSAMRIAMPCFAYALIFPSFKEEI